jgi:hypothetical protein
LLNHKWISSQRTEMRFDNRRFNNFLGVVDQEIVNSEES